METIFSFSSRRETPEKNQTNELKNFDLSKINWGKPVIQSEKLNEVYNTKQSIVLNNQPLILYGKKMNEYKKPAETTKYHSHERIVFYILNKELNPEEEMEFDKHNFRNSEDALKNKTPYVKFTFEASLEQNWTKDNLRTICITLFKKDPDKTLPGGFAKAFYPRLLDYIQTIADRDKAPYLHEAKFDPWCNSKLIKGCPSSDQPCEWEDESYLNHEQWNKIFRPILSKRSYKQVDDQRYGTKWIKKYKPSIFC